MASVHRDDNFIRFAPAATNSEETMSAALQLLLRAIGEDTNLHILFDFRECAFSSRHILFMMKTLFKCEYSIPKVARAAALIHETQFSRRLYNLAIRIYPLPKDRFVVETDENRALHFVNQPA